MLNFKMNSKPTHVAATNEVTAVATVTAAICEAFLKQWKHIQPEPFTNGGRKNILYALLLQLLHIQRLLLRNEIDKQGVVIIRVR